MRRLWDKHDQVDPPRRLSFVANPKAVRPSAKRKPLDEQISPRLVRDNSARSQTLADQNEVGESPRDRFTFENFVVGQSNELAMAVARQVAQNTGKDRPPQYLSLIHI